MPEKRGERMKICPTCGKEIEDGVKICEHCGAAAGNDEKVDSAPADPEKNEAYAGTEISESEGDDTETDRTSQKRNRRKAVVIAAGLCAVVFLSGIIYREHRRSKTYNEAVTLMEQEEYDKAEELFLNIPGYKNTTEYLEIIENQRTYEEALKWFEEEDYDEAEEAFRQIESYKDAADYLEQISQIRAYRDALALYEQGEYAAALQIIDGITVYEPAEQLGETMRSELEYNSYVNLLDQYELSAESGAVHAHTLIKQVSAVWYNAIYKVDDPLTDSYAKDAQGEFYSDFNRALASYYTGEVYQQLQDILKEEEKQTGELYAALQNVPAGLEASFEQVITVQASFAALAEYALSPEGSYAEYVSKGEKLYQQFTSDMSAMSSQLPERLSMHKEDAIAAPMTDPLVSTMAVQLQEIVSEQMLEGVTADYEDFAAAYQETYGTDLSLITDQMVCTGTEEEPYIVLVIRTEKEFDGNAYVKEAADYLQREEHTGISADITDVLLANNEDTDILVIAKSNAIGDAQQYLVESGYTVEVLKKDGITPEIYGVDQEETELYSEAAEDAADEDDSENGMESVGELPSDFARYAENETESAADEILSEDTETEHITEGRETVAEVPVYDHDDFAEEFVSEAAEEAEESISEAAAEEAEEPVSEAAAEKAEESVSEAAAEEAEESVSEDAAEETEESVSEDAAEETEESVSEAAAEEAEESISEAAVEEAEESISEAAVEEAEESVSEAAVEKTEESISEDAAEKAEESVSEAAAEEAEESISEAAAEKAEESVSEAAVEETEESVSEAAVEETDVLEEITEKVVELAIAPREEETEGLTEELTEEAAYESVGETSVNTETEGAHGDAEDEETESLSESLTEGVSEALTEAFSEAWNFLKNLPLTLEESRGEEGKTQTPETEWLGHGIDPQYEKMPSQRNTAVPKREPVSFGVEL